MPEPAGEIAEHTAELRELPVFWRSAPPVAGEAPALYLHGVPTNCDDWSPFLARSGGFAVDLPGFGRSGKPGYLTYTIPEYEGFLESYLELIDIERVQLVMHDWGAVGLAFAQRHPERIARLVLIDTIPFLPGYRWHPVARVWRTRGVGELAMGVTTKLTVRMASRLASSTPGNLPAPLAESVFDHFDYGTQRAILRLYRSAPPEVLAGAGERLSALDMPALVVWGERDPYIPTRFARDYASALADSELAVVERAGHWPWLEDPSVIDRVVAFLGVR
jgi:pimeloyl-ACP methyl ester carboxylesterase